MCLIRSFAIQVLEARPHPAGRDGVTGGSGFRCLSRTVAVESCPEHQDRVEQESESRKMTLSIVSRAADLVRGSEKPEDILDAHAMLAEAIRSCPEADLQSAPFYGLLNQAHNMVSVDVANAQGSTGSTEACAS